MKNQAGLMPREDKQSTAMDDVNVRPSIISTTSKSGAAAATRRRREVTRPSLPPLTKSFHVGGETPTSVFSFPLLVVPSSGFTSLPEEHVFYSDEINEGV